MNRLLGSICLTLGILTTLLAGCDTSRNAVSATEERDGIRLTLWSPHNDYEKGEIVRVLATLENISDKTIVLESQDEPVFDITYVINGAVISWADQHPELADNRLELDPGEKVEVEISYTPSQETYYIFTSYWWGQMGTMKTFVSLGIHYGVFEG